MLNLEPQWVAVYTNPRAEKKVQEKFANAGFDCYLPLQRQLRKWSDRNKWVEMPLFPSYVFVKICATDVVFIRNTIGVVMIVSFGRNIAVVPEREIAAIRRILEEDHEFVVENSLKLVKNARVRVLAGPFKDMEGTLVSNSKDGNFSVNIEALSASIVMTIDRELLEFVPDNAKETSNKFHF